MEEVGFSWGVGFERVSFSPSALKYTDVEKELIEKLVVKLN